MLYNVHKLLMSENLPYQGTTNSEPRVTVINNTVADNTKNGNGLGVAGFVIALIAFIFSWAPGVNWVLWFLGFLFSLIAVFKKPRGLAIAGLIISFIDVILIVAVIGAVAAILS